MTDKNRQKTTANTTAKRKPISKKIRFEVLKRDKFTCQYCGKSAPEVVLHIDHIKPVAAGGKNTITNLITSCIDCNLGKGKRELSDDSVVVKQRTELELQQERINQIRLMSEWQMSLISSSDAETDSVNDMLTALTGVGANDHGIKTIKKHIKRYGFQSVLEATRLSFEQYYYDDCSDSWEKAFNMIPKIAAVRSKPQWQQDAIKYSCYAKKYGGAFTYNDQSLFKDIISKGGKMCDLDYESIYKRGMDLRDYCEAIMDAAGLVYEEAE